MIHRLLVFAILIASMVFIVNGEGYLEAQYLSPTLVLGFLLLSAYCISFFLEKLKLPRITGYIIAGLMLGPYLFGFYQQETIDNLSFLNSMALAFIAFCAGGELKLSYFRYKLKAILYLMVGGTLIIFVGVTGVVFGISGMIPFMESYPIPVKLAISCIFGVIAVARSPSSAIAIISEIKAKGEYTDTVLSVIIVTDVVIIVLFGIVLSFCQAIFNVGSSIDPTFILGLVFEILISFISGFFLGKATIFLIDKVRVEFPVVILIVGFMVIKFSHFIGNYLHESYNIGLNLEPLLICIAAGFTVQNFSEHGEVFLARLDKISFPVYIAFFALTGASINIEILKSGWFLGLVIVVVRIVMIMIGSFFSGKLSGDKPEIYKNTWLGFITQAGVSIGLLTEVVRRFPEIGVPIQTVLIASIVVNQLAGPIAFKYALIKVGETNMRG